MGTSNERLISCKYCVYSDYGPHKEPCKRCTYNSEYIADTERLLQAGIILRVYEPRTATSSPAPVAKPAATALEPCHTHSSSGSKPTHYSGMTVDVIDFCLRNGIPYPEGNVIKYVCRWRKKGGIADLEKARDYLDRLIAHEKSEGAIHA